MTIRAHRRRRADRSRHGQSRASGWKRCSETLEQVGLDPTLHQSLSARILRRPAAAGQHCPGAGHRSASSSCSTSRSRPSTFRSNRRSSICWSTCSEQFKLTYLFISHDLSVVRIHFRPRGRDVSGRDRRDGPQPRSVPPSAASLYACAAVVGADARPDPQKQVGSCSPGDVPSPIESARRLPLSSPLPVGDGRLPHGGSRANCDFAGHKVPLPRRGKGNGGGRGRSDRSEPSDPRADCRARSRRDHRWESGGR